VKRNCQKAAYKILVKFTLKDGDQSVAQMMGSANDGLFLSRKRKTKLGNNW